MYQIDDERVLNAIVSAHAVCKAPSVYKMDNGFAGHASIDAMFDYVKSKVQKPIIMRDTSFEGRHVGSRLEVYTDRIEIDVRSDQGDAWKRFCTAKELIHLLIDRDDDCSPYGHHRIEEMLDRGLIGLASGNNPTGRPTQSELVAEIAAVEIMYPVQQIISDLEALDPDNEENRINIKKMALIRQMPDFYVSTALRTDFRGFLVEAFKSCERRNEA